MTAAYFRSVLRFFLQPAWLLLALLLVPAAAFGASPALEQASSNLTVRGVDAAASGDLGSARRFFEEAIVANPANAGAYAQLGSVYRALGDVRTARKYYGIALSIDPSEPDALNRLAQLDLADGNRAGADEKLRMLRFFCPACIQTQELADALQNPSSPAPSSP
jgi:Flp pilus assembly protein TadD